MSRPRNFSPEIIAFGNILLDMTVKIDSTELLEHYGLSLEAQGEISAESLAEISEHVRQRSAAVNFNPGGSALNSCRIIRKLATAEAVFFGAVGKDATASVLQEKLQRQDVPVRLQVVDNAATGQCICFVYGDRTALYANIGASRMFSKEFLLEKAENFESFVKSDKEQVIYIEGFFVPHRFEVCRYIVDLCTSRSKKLAINLNAAYILRENFDEIKHLTKAAFLIFGNEREFKVLAELLEHSSVSSLVKELLSLGSKVIVVTNGAEKVCMYSNLNSVTKHFELTPEQIPPEKIVDTTGAGDSLVAGFLAAFVNKIPLEECLVAGCEVASRVITKVGCNLD